jgi:hypothetical protein
MLHLAELAVEASERLDAALCGPEPLADLRAQAWSGLANACRVSDRLALAETAMARACAARKEGTGSPLLRARLAELSASLLCDQRHFPAAFRLLDLAYRLYRRHGEMHDAGRALITKGLHTGYTGDPEEGIRLIARGLRRIERELDPQLVVQGLHNILLFRVELGDFRAARQQLWEMRPLYAVHADRIAQVKLRWIEGKIFVGLCELERAEAALLQAREAFAQEGLTYDGALVSFDLAAVWLRQGKTSEVHRLASEMLDTFRARYIAREALASLLMLRDAAERNEATLDLIELVASVFSRIEPDRRADPFGAKGTSWRTRRQPRGAGALLRLGGSAFQAVQLLAQGAADEALDLSPGERSFVGLRQRRLVGARDAELVQEPDGIPRRRGAQEQAERLEAQLPRQGVDVPDLQLDPAAEQASQIALPQSQLAFDLPA